MILEVVAAAACGSGKRRVERFSGQEWVLRHLTADLLQRSDHRSVKALEADIRTWTKNWNANSRPFMWIKTADQILESLARLLNEITAMDSRYG